MNAEMQKFIIDCIMQARGDDLLRAKTEFERFSFEDMNKEYYQCGQTPQQILDEYQTHSDRCDEAIDAVRNL